MASTPVSDSQARDAEEILPDPSGEHRNPVQTHLDPFAVVWGGEDRPFDYPELQRQSRGQHYESQTEAANLAEALGRSTAASRIRRRLGNWQDRHGFTPAEGMDIEDFSDWRSMGPGSADLGVAGLVRNFKRRTIQQARANPGSIDVGRAVARFKTRLEQSLQGKMTEGVQKELTDYTDPIMEQAQHNALTPAISATQENELSSRIVALTRTAEANRLARVGAAIGLGNLGNSPALAALAAENAAEADRSIVGATTDLGLKVSSLNREQSRMDTALASQLAAQRWAILNGNAQSLSQLTGDLAATIDAYYSRDADLALRVKALEESGKGDPGRAAAAGAIQGGAAGATLGPWGAVIGAGVGAGAGYLGNR